MISALLIEAPLRLGEFSPKLYLVAKMKQDLHHHLEVGLEAAVAGSIVLLNHLSEQNESLVIRAKRDGSLVSAVDIESHRAISAILQQSKLPIISEEGDLPPYSIRSQWTWYWLVDPLDGTEAYLKSREGFAVNIALCNDQGPVIGIVSDPLTKNIYAGMKGLPPFIARLDDLSARETIIASTAKKPYLLVTSWDERMPLNELLPNRFDPKDFESKPVSGALKFCQIATGEADVHARSASYMEWDCAAGDGILRSMGITVRDRDTDLPLQYNTMSLRAGNLYASRID